MIQKKKLQIFISSTYSDLREERQAAVEAVLMAGHIPAGMELFAAGDESQMNVIKRWIDESDIFMLILGGRYGSLDPKTHKSYIQLEYEYAIQKGKPLFALVVDDNYIKKKVKKYGSSVIEQDNPNKLRQFKEVVCSRMVRFWNDPKDIKLSIMEAITDLNNRSELVGWIPGNEVLSKSVVEEHAYPIDEDAFFEKIEFSNRSGFKKAFQQRIKNANYVGMLGINLNSLISPNVHVIEENAKNGCRFEFIMVEDEFFDRMGSIAYATWPGGTESQKDLGRSVDIVKSHILSKSGNFKLRFISLAPPYSMVLIDPEADNGEIQIELYTYQRNTHERPHFILTKKENPHWYEFFLNEFRAAWGRSRNAKSGLKPTNPKAGVVLYKQTNNHYEVLIVTARLHQDTWIFPVGTLERNETEKETAIREGGEEGGYLGEPATLKYLAEIYIDRGEVIDKLTFFLAKAVSEIPPLKEGRKRKWVRLEELDDVILDAFRPILQPIKNELALL